MGVRFQSPGGGASPAQVLFAPTDIHAVTINNVPCTIGAGFLLRATTFGKLQFLEFSFSFSFTDPGNPNSIVVHMPPATNPSAAGSFYQPSGCALNGTTGVLDITNFSPDNGSPADPTLVFTSATPFGVGPTIITYLGQLNYSVA